ncbi:XRE family transcriptional regulator [Brevibacillus laterosporus]|uniref:XRE family transcriptional regulator n=1 Tax=Brevibacillus laterosporus TaxID=1465 RepID=A0A518V4W3_BRELA|nr:XRE family transcriptional regulator [Brevibacillus laterosporus]
MSFGKSLRKYRKLSNYSQIDLSKKTNIPQTTISDFENEKYLPNIRQGFLLATALGVTLNDLYEESKQPA